MASHQLLSTDLRGKAVTLLVLGNQGGGSCWPQAGEPCTWHPPGLCEVPLKSLGQREMVSPEGTSKQMLQLDTLDPHPKRLSFTKGELG